jgi:hypothetical protein
LKDCIESFEAAMNVADYDGLWHSGSRVMFPSNGSPARHLPENQG